MGEAKYRVGIATSDGIVVNQHFGRAAQFVVVDVAGNGKIQFVERRAVDPICIGRNHNEEQLEANVEILRDCRYVLVSRIGPEAANALERHGISAYEIPGLIQDAVNKLLAYIEIQAMLS